jgi:hypothetical protein
MGFEVEFTDAGGKATCALCCVVKDGANVGEGVEEESKAT